MKSLFAALCISVLLCSGCATSAAIKHINEDIVAKVTSDVQAITIPDLDAAIATATQNNDTDGLACWAEVKAYVLSWPTAPGTPLPTIAGIASSIEAGRVTRLNRAPLLPPIPASMHRACAVVLVDLQTVVAKLGVGAAAAAHGLTVPALPQP